MTIEPVDAWFFRDGRPSNRGEDQSDITSEFPPNPTTVVGALRAAFARANGWTGSGSWAEESSDLKDVLGDGFDDLGNLMFLGPFLGKEDEREGEYRRWDILLPLPQHVAGRMVEGRFVPEVLLEPSQELVCCDANPSGVRLPAVPVNYACKSAGDEPKKPPTHPEGIFVTSNGFNAIVRGELPNADDCIPANELYSHESRIGIRRDAETRTTGRGDIYSPRYLRLKRGVSLVHAVRGIPTGWMWPTLMPLGGESRLAAIQRLDQAPEMPTLKNGEAALAIALTPVRFGTYWWGAGPGQPAAALSSELSGNVICVALARPRLIGGWDFKTNSPRTLAPFAPAGTVWWLENGATDTPGFTHFGLLSEYGYGLIALATDRQ